LALAIVIVGMIDMNKRIHELVKQADIEFDVPSNIRRNVMDAIKQHFEVE
jgi:hypothetical protein